MISTLAKYPWWAVNHYTVKDRDVLFQTTEKMLRALANAVKYKQFNIVHERLLAEFQETSLKAPGFSEKQKTRLILAAKPSPTGVTISRIATDWPFETLVRNPNASDEMVEFYAYLFRKATMSPTMVSLAEHSAAEASNAATSLFGNIVIPWSSSKETMTFAEAASQEWAVVEALLRRLLCVP
ncbi:hypothetical protein L228DRAFT_182818 [Xylona heveae TC161]|uniref:Uncharacterized protein n=1 Tax=Xylona heveae (strain CBS 132557 / TC161) TaxID=1328760 RepID=A0A165FG51_XYLHT|nr:hypothetical protein L228DRAFT_182818 [Xylona heveae TC161]KZF20937.1 hypothetical protein L228DRAFT_182818 [Xylona heveae TC161]